VAKRAWQILKAFAPYTDVVVTLLASVVVAGVVAAAKLSEHAAIAATLLVLGAVSFSLLHDRSSREKMKAFVGEAIYALERAVTSDAPYETVELHVGWNIAPGDGTTTLTMKRQVAFLQNNVAVVYSFAGSEPGAGVQFKGARGAPEGSGLLHGLTRQQTPVRDEYGNQLYLVSLDRLARAGDCWNIEETWEFTGAFPDTTERVKQTVKFPMRQLTLQLDWPADRSPSDVRITRTHGKPRDTVQPVRRRRNRGSTFSRRFDDPVVGEVLIFEWTW